MKIEISWKEYQINENVKKRKLSASRLQTFYDCPRKYYFQYIDEMEINILPEKTVQPRFLGDLEHAIIGDYLKGNKTWNETTFSSVVSKVFEMFKTKHSLDLAYTQTGTKNIFRNI